MLIKDMESTSIKFSFFQINELRLCLTNISFSEMFKNIFMVTTSQSMLGVKMRSALMIFLIRSQKLQLVNSTLMVRNNGQLHLNMKQNISHAFSSPWLLTTYSIPEKPMTKCTGFSYNGPKLFNKLPCSIKETNNPTVFKTQIKNWIWKNIPAY